MKNALIGAILSGCLVATSAVSETAQVPRMSSKSVEESTVDGGGNTAVWVALGVAAVILVATTAGTSSAPVPLPSDERLKTNISPAGWAANGLPLYSYSYRGLDGVYLGVMAQDVLAFDPEAVVTMSNGYMAVDYQRLGIEFKRLH